MLRGAVEVKESAAAQSVKRFKYHAEMAEIISRVGYTLHRDNEHRNKQNAHSKVG